jgi:hypothetical protein
MTISISNAVRSLRAQALGNAINAGSGAGRMELYGDTRPTNANTAVTTQTLLATLTFNDPAFTESGGVLTCDVTPAPAEDAALATEQCTWARILDSDNNVICDLSEGTDFTLTDDTLETGQAVTIVSLTITEAAS